MAIIQIIVRILQTPQVMLKLSKASSNWFILPAGRTKIKEGIVMMFASSVSIRWKNGPSNAEMYLHVCSLVIGDTCAVASFIKWTCAIITTRISSLGMLF